MVGAPPDTTGVAAGTIVCSKRFRLTVTWSASSTLSWTGMKVGWFC